MICSCTVELPFYSYGILLLAAFIAGFVVYRRNCLQAACIEEDPIDLSLAIILPAVIGARVAYILLFPQHFDGLSDYLALHEGGLVFYGGLIGVLVSLLAYAAAKSISLPRLFDFLSPSFALAHAIGRWGCIINGCCYGIITDRIAIYRLKNDADGIFRHPVAAYESILLLLLFFILIRALKQTYINSRLFSGFTSGIYLIAYSFCRFLLEFIRGDNRGEALSVFWLSPSQTVAVLLMLSGIMWLVYWCKNSNTGVNSDGKN
jgi:phosphatidylglycerol:prolipoprotein diacylglycerol transferase